MSTMKGCPDGKMIEADIPVHLDNASIGYNSKLPIVIYAPKEVKISYRLWSTSEAIQPANIQNK
ncbi:ecotin family protein [Testudinibacter sp. P27/CKL/0425]